MESTLIMPDETIPMVVSEPKPNGESSFFGASVRAWVVIILVVTCCVLALLRRDIPDFLQYITLGFGSVYLGQKIITLPAGSK
jgi:hypothetical protein